jgi:hypothetical protein
MGNSAQKRAIENYRSRLTERGIARFEIQALDADRDLLRSLARKLTEDGPEAGQLRRTIRQAVAGEPPKAGGILATLRRSPLVRATAPSANARGFSLRRQSPADGDLGGMLTLMRQSLLLPAPRSPSFAVRPQNKREVLKGRLEANCHLCGHVRTTSSATAR